MGSISFEEEKRTLQQSKQNSTMSTSSSGMSAWLVRRGLAANHTSANVTLLAFAVIALVTAYLVYDAVTPKPLTIEINKPPQNILDQMRGGRMP